MSNSIAAKVNAKVGFEPWGNGATAFTSLFHRNQWVNTSDISHTGELRNSVVVATSRALYAEELAIDLDLTVRHCVYVRVLHGREPKCRS